MSDTPRLPVTSPGDLIVAVPYLLGFHPTDSLVLVGLTGRRVTVAGRTDLPDPAATVGGVEELMRQQLRMLHQADVTATVVIGYGPSHRVTPVVDTVVPRLREAGLTVLDALRVTDRRYYSYLCQNLTCCPIDGVPFDPDHSDIALHAIVAGCSTLPDRRALVASIAPIDGPSRHAVTRATHRARTHRRALSAVAGRDALIRAGEDIVRTTFARYAADQVLTDDELAWLTVLLPITAVRDAAWRATDAQPWHIALWSDVTRRAEPALAAPPASLLAFTAWRSGLGALASVAVDRALQANPTYSLAHLLDRMLREALPPSVLDGWPDQDFPTTP
ncbi:DUF4192 domain-containing protein [Micromonospora sp. R77]|uniref:DUF4192 domain-containing protein n=1 Tax=Micromonospora sp. R77 TaxID=2925836 RepID=UPI001F61F048|nr:DUF4192 domain-containing protein [Micromonospora sp. R77]MCI4066179.1 DUF4192 domain-containing protein [Micromonospora sp. R77]